jgi:SAM-dependent methyltransferase
VDAVRRAARSPRRWLERPLTRGRDLDAPETTRLRRQVVEENRLLAGVYREWYRLLSAALPAGGGALLELGAGAAPESELPAAFRSELFWCPWLDITLDAMALPFADRSLHGVLMVNVLHHLPRPAAFLAEAARCVRPGGVLAMIEPWNTAWSRWVYQRFHHEPFLPAAGWEGPGGGALTGANGALPWILFHRDRERLAREHPGWRLRAVEPLMPLRYLVAGGISLRSLAPAVSAPLWVALERALRPLRHRLGMFALLVLERLDAGR